MRPLTAATKPYQTNEDSWREQRQFLDLALTALEDHPLVQSVQNEYEDLVAAEPDLVASIDQDYYCPNGGIIRFGSDGSLIRLYDPYNKNPNLRSGLYFLPGNSSCDDSSTKANTLVSRKVAASSAVTNSCGFRTKQYNSIFFRSLCMKDITTKMTGKTVRPAIFSMLMNVDYSLENQMVKLILLVSGLVCQDRPWQDNRETRHRTLPAKIVIRTTTVLLTVNTSLNFIGKVTQQHLARAIFVCVQVDVSRKEMLLCGPSNTADSSLTGIARCHGERATIIHVVDSADDDVAGVETDSVQKEMFMLSFNTSCLKQDIHNIR
ncbi:hypothetical protein Btru_054219 [Bulinus truncatus]|nr:hypothetical protein Btru_054219 [Bulinus truncatus]